MQYFGFDRPSFGFKTIGFPADLDPDAEIKALFAGGKQGAFYNPSDLSTLWQDAARTIPVTKHNDPVGFVEDLSGNGNHAMQTVSASRPVYQTDGILHWLYFDGVDDTLLISNIASITQPFSICLSKNEEYKPTVRYVSSSEGSIGRFADNIWSLSWGAGAVSKQLGVNHTAKVILATSKGTESEIQADGIAYNITGGTGGVLRGSLNIFGSLTGSNANGKLYSLLIAQSLTYTDKTNVQKYLAKKSGVTL